MLSMLTHRAGGKGDAPHTHVPEHFEQRTHVLEGSIFDVHSALKYCRHACIVGVCDMRALSQQTPLLIRSKVLSEASVVSSAARYSPHFRSVNVGH